MIRSCAAHVTMTATFPIVHRCPYRDETDKGIAEIAWTTAGDTLELHDLADWLASFADEVVSHEALTDHIAHCLDELDGITDVHVTTRWATAGAEVAVRAVPGECLIGAGA